MNPSGHPPAPHPRREAGLEEFATTASQALRERPLRDALPVLETALVRLLQDSAFVDAHFDAGTPEGKRLLHEDAATGFRVLAHVQPAGHGSAPHDHGSSWAVYGTVQGSTGMVEYRRVDDGSAAAVLQAVASYTLEAGQARAYPPGCIHATSHAEPAWVLRVTGGNLDVMPRFRFRKSVDTLLPAAT